MGGWCVNLDALGLHWLDLRQSLGRVTTIDNNQHWKMQCLFQRQFIATETLPFIFHPHLYKQIQRGHDIYRTSYTYDNTFWTCYISPDTYVFLSGCLAQAKLLEAGLTCCRLMGIWCWNSEVFHTFSNETLHWCMQHSSQTRHPQHEKHYKDLIRVYKH